MGPICFKTRTFCHSHHISRSAYVNMTRYLPLSIHLLYQVYTNHHHQEFSLKLLYQQNSHVISSIQSSCQNTTIIQFHTLIHSKHTNFSSYQPNYSCTFTYFIHYQDKQSATEVKDIEIVTMELLISCNKRATLISKQLRFQGTHHIVIELMLWLCTVVATEAWYL